MQIRPAVAADASNICAVVRASIIELCGEDHHGDTEVLGAWLSNKTPETVAVWVANPNNRILVAVEGDAVLGVGCITVWGEVLLNYVAPGARFRGVSTAMMAALETVARDLGLTACALESTVTAHGFYRVRGWRDVDTPGEKHGMTTHRMVKDL